MKNKKLLKVLSAVALASTLSTTSFYSNYNVSYAAETTNKEYSLPLKIMHASENRPSMANAAVVSAKVKKVGNLFEYTVVFKNITFSGLSDGISRLWVDNKELTLTPVSGEGNPVQATFTSPTLKENFDIKVFVKTMEEIMPGGGTQNARMVFDISNVPASINETPTPTPNPETKPETPKKDENSNGTTNLKGLETMKENDKASTEAYLGNSKNASKKSAFDVAFDKNVTISKSNNLYNYTFKLHPANMMNINFELGKITFNNKEVPLTTVDAENKIKEGTITTSELVDKLNILATSTGVYAMTHPAIIVLNLEKATVTKETTVKEDIPFETESLNNPSLPKGVKKETRTGEKGEKTTIYTVTEKADGTELKKELKSSSVTKKPVSQIIEIGTKENNNSGSKKEDSLDLTKAQSIPVKLMHANENRLSMGNKAIKGAYVYKENGVYHYIINMEDIKFAGISDGISRFWVDGREVTLTKLKGANNPVQAHFTSTKQLSTVNVDVFVNAMEQIMPGGGRQSARLVFDWSNLGSTSPFVNEEPLPTLPITDPNNSSNVIDNHGSSSNLPTLKNGYLVPTSLMNYHQPNKVSMGNRAIVDTFVYEENGVYHYIVTLQDISFMGQTDGISRFWVNGNEVGVYKVNRPGLLNPVQVHFTDSQKLSTVDVEVFVNAMEQIQAGGGRQKARLVFDWNNATKVERNINNGTLPKTGDTVTNVSIFALTSLTGLVMLLLRRKQK